MLLLRQLLSSVQVTSVTGWLEIVSPSGVSSGSSPAPPGPGVQQTGKEQRGTRAVSLPQVDITPIVSMDELPEAKASEQPRFPIKKVVGTNSIDKSFSILVLWNTIYSIVQYSELHALHRSSAVESNGTLVREESFPNGSLCFAR